MQVGAAIRDYNGMAFVQHHQNMEQHPEGLEMVCNAEFDFEAAAAAAPNRKLLQVSNNQTCPRSRTSSSRSRPTPTLPPARFSASAPVVNTRAPKLQFQGSSRPQIYNNTLSLYKSAVVGYNSAVADKFTKKAAARRRLASTR